MKDNLNTFFLIIPSQIIGAGCIAGIIVSTMFK